MTNALAPETVAFFRAINADDAQEVSAALDAGMDVDTKDVAGQTGLVFASLGGHAEVTEVLLEAGASTSVTHNGASDGYPPLHAAAFQGRAAVVKLLLAAGLDPTAQHEDGLAAFHRACNGKEARHTATVRVFLESGVEADVQGKAGRSCSSVAGNAGTRELLRQWVAP